MKKTISWKITSNSEDLSASNLLKQARSSFDGIVDQRTNRKSIPLSDALMSGLAMFSMKCPSLLQFDEKRKNEVIRHNLMTMYGIQTTPSDTQMRSILDEIDFRQLSSSFCALHQSAVQAGVMEQYHFMNGHVLVSIDGTGHFSSGATSCPQCCVKKHRDGREEYYHQLLCATVVHPDYPVVIPLMPEPIMKEDGDNKNDCERNASKRLLKHLSEQYKHLKPIIIEDSLSANGPHLKLLKSLGMSYIIGVKEGDHSHLFDLIQKKMCQGEAIEFEKIDDAGIIHGFRFINGVRLNKSHPDLLVNFLEYWQIKKGKEVIFSWITDIELTKETVFKVMQGGRARWKIENETFNTLKNQGYNLEHNYGHGEKNLSSVFGCLTFMAFLIDQLQAWGCELFKSARQSRRTLISLWHRMIELFTSYLIPSWEVLWKAIANGYSAGTLEIDSS